MELLTIGGVTLVLIFVQTSCPYITLWR